MRLIEGPRRPLSLIMYLKYIDLKIGILKLEIVLLLILSITVSVTAHYYE
jgi:hypothetical protein